MGEFKPFPYQREAIKSIINKFKEHERIVFQLDTGGGKCLGENTPILMYDGTIKMVQDVRVGEIIMGDDSTPRRVLSLARGKEKLYRITPVKGDSFVVNESHILSLKVTGIKRGLKHGGVTYYKGDVIDICVKDYLKKSDAFKHCTKQYRVPVEFKCSELHLDPYFLGLWLGDGTSSNSSITTMDSAIINYLDELVEKRKLHSRIEHQKNNKSVVYHITSNFKRNGILQDLKRLNLIGNKHIPLIFKTASREDRLQLLAGIIDSDGYLNKGKFFEVTFKSDLLSNDLVYLCRSLGFSAYSKKVKKSCVYKGEVKEGLYNHVTISGDCSIVPVKLERKKAGVRSQIKDVLVTGFSIEDIGVGDYYGFEIDGNRRFVLGDFTVTHNTACFSFLSKYWVEKYKNKVLILCHREELISQACETLVKAGLTFEKITPSTKRLTHASDVYVAMIETLDRRLKKNPKYLFNVGLVVADEAHVQIFNKVYDYFDNAKILGVTATPVLLGRDTFFRCSRCNTESNEVFNCCGQEAMEWTRPKTMSSIYSDIVVGPKIDFLIESGQLVREINFVKDYVDTDSLTIDSTGEFSNKEQDEAFGSDNSLFNVVLNYEELCKGKRTIIFNNSAKTNLKVHDQLKEKGYNVKLFDSVNDTDVSRKQLVKWFRENDDAILCNVGVFVAGFDVKEVQAIILNVATTSLSRYLQMVGRGGRSTDKIYKDNFIVIDGGGNVNRFNAWSDNTRDWHSIFFNGIGKEKPKKEIVEQIKECENCGYYMGRTATECPECGTPIVTQKREKTEGHHIAKPLDKIPLPNGEKIYRYTVSQGENIHFAHKILINQILDLFIFYQVSKELYEKTKNNGKLDEKISKMIRSCFFVLMAKKDIQSGSNRTLKYLKDKTKERLEKYYGDK